MATSVVADGIAVGTAALSPDGCVGLLVGIAMVLHKGPVAFGVTAYFSSISMPLQRIKRGSSSHKMVLT